ANELLLMSDDCSRRSPVYHTLAGAALLDVNGPAARRYFVEAKRCNEPHLGVVNELAEIARMDPQPGDLGEVQSLLNQVRDRRTLTRPEEAMAYQIEGRLVIDHDRNAGAALLRKAIAEADATPRDIFAEKARAGAFGVLVFDAASVPDYP